MNARVKIAEQHEGLIDALVGQSRGGASRKAGAASPFSHIREVAVFAAGLGFALASGPSLEGVKTKNDIRYDAMKAAPGAVELIDVLAFVEQSGNVDLFASNSDAEANRMDAFNRYCHGGLLWLAQRWGEKAIGLDGAPHGNYTAHDLILEAISQNSPEKPDVYDEPDFIPRDTLLNVLERASV